MLESGARLFGNRAPGCFHHPVADGGTAVSSKTVDTIENRGGAPCRLKRGDVLVCNNGKCQLELKVIRACSHRKCAVKGWNASSKCTPVANRSFCTSTRSRIRHERTENGRAMLLFFVCRSWLINSRYQSMHRSRSGCRNPNFEEDSNDVNLLFCRLQFGYVQFSDNCL